MDLTRHLSLRSIRRLAVCAFAAALTAATAGTAVAQETGLEIGAHAPTPKVETLAGIPGDLALYVGKVPVVIEFWATWCENCKELEPTLLAVQKKYAGKVTFIGVAVGVNQSPDLVKRYVEKHKLAGAQFYDRKGKAVEAYDVPATSYVVVIDKKGIVRYGGVGGKQDLDAAIKKIL